MAKYRDRSSMGPSSICPKQGDDWKSRHERRKSTAHRLESELETWCQERGLVLKINNDGHHWIVRLFDGESIDMNVEWWPSTAKAVAGLNAARFRHGIHCHDIEQLKVIIERELKRLRDGM